MHGLGGHPQETWQYGKRSKATTSETRRKRFVKFLHWKDKISRAHADASLRLLQDEQRQVASLGVRAGNDPGSEASNGCYWPYDLLPSECKNVRILTYGYDSHPSHFYLGGTVQMTISQHSQQLLHSVTNVRADCRGRPVIFVAHSLGGILVKDALIESKEYEDQPSFLDLSKCCSAIIFFGTPHHGANAASYGEIVGSIVGALPLFPSVYKGILRELKPDGEKLMNVSRNFNSLLNKNVPARNKIQLCSFQEGKPLTRLKVFDGKAKNTFPNVWRKADDSSRSSPTAHHSSIAETSNAMLSLWRII